MFTKGKKRTGGRIKGQAAKVKLTVRELCEKHKVDVVGELLALRSELHPKDQAKILIALLPYSYPAMRQTEITGSVDHNHNEPRVIITIPSNGREVKQTTVSEVLAIPPAVNKS